MISKYAVKKILIFSVIFGLIEGIITIIPIVNFFSFMILIFCCAPIILYIAQKTEIIGIIDIKQAVGYGYIIGFIAFITFSLTFIPLSTIIGAFYKNSFYLGINTLFKEGFFVLSLMVIFIAIMFSGLMNAFGAMVYYWIKSLINKNNDYEKIDSIDFEIKE